MMASSGWLWRTRFRISGLGFRTSVPKKPTRWVYLGSSRRIPGFSVRYKKGLGSRGLGFRVRV